MKKSSLLVLAAVGFAATQVHASGASWLSYPRSARNVAEAGGLGVMGTGLNAPGLNPAGLSEMTAKGQLQLSHSSWAADIRAEHLGAAFAGPGSSVLGFSGTWVDFGGIQGYALEAGGGLSETHSIHPYAGSLSAAWAGPVAGSGWQAGVGASLLQQSLDGKSTAMAPALEAGVTGRLGGGFKLGLSALNIGGDLDGSPLPLQARLGLAWASAMGGVQLGVEAADQSRGARQPDLFAALRLRVAQGLSAHLGWQQLEGAQAQPSGGLSFSVSERWDLDYGFRQQGDVGGTHHLSLGLRWG
jgi:hypothetical protein